jgi:EAL and modified HD-GYP domain-containing signal transduction protein
VKAQWKLRQNVNYRMAGDDLPSQNSDPIPSGLADVFRYLARQPILDLHSKVHAYELLFRAGPEATFRGDGDFATRTMLDNSVIFGIEKLAAGLPAFVNCTMESLTERLVEVLPHEITVLEILETLEPTPELIAACRKLKAAGYRIALDDFLWNPKFEPLVELADYIKVDFTLTDAVGRQELLKRLIDTSAVLVAEKVETQEEYKQARAEGFTLFQGYYFCRPVLLKRRKIPANCSSHFQILELLQHDPLDLRQLSQLVKRNSSLTFRFLRLVNSPLCGMSQTVRSIQSALLVIGDDTVRRVATLAIASELNINQPPEILRMAFVRGRFCELAAGLCALGQAEQYLLGMFSLLPAMLCIPMADLALALPLREKIREALLGRVSIESSLLKWVESHELGDWVRCDAIVHSYGLNLESMFSCYAEATIWADAVMKLAR